MTTTKEIDKQITQLKQELDSVQGTPTEVYTRIVGYYRSVNNWNPGKREEYGRRRVFTELTSKIEFSGHKKVNV